MRTAEGLEQTLQTRGVVTGVVTVSAGSGWGRLAAAMGDKRDISSPAAGIRE